MTAPLPSFDPDFMGPPVPGCRCGITRGRAGSGGLWCLRCGRLAHAVDSRPCGRCAHFSALPTGAICRRHLMRVTPCLLVTYPVATGSCWTAPAPACADCGDDEAGLVKLAGVWLCDACAAARADEADLDLEAWEENRRARLAEQAEY